MKQSRLDSIEQAWGKLDAEGKGQISLEQLVTAYDARKHPAVLKGYCTDREIFDEFVKMWDKDSDGIVTKTEFVEYFKVRLRRLYE